MNEPGEKPLKPEKTRASGTVPAMPQVMSPLRKHEKPFRYENHADKRMRQRGISATEIREVLARPDKKRPADDRDADVFERRLSKGRRVCVVAEVREKFIRIVTAWVRK